MREIRTSGSDWGSPLLSNVVLNDLDQWIVKQWEQFQSRDSFTTKGYRTKVLKKTNLKEGYIVRYADDFKILCRDWKTAQKWFHAVRLYLKDRLKLDISPEKSQIVNLRKRESEFLGFTIRAIKKGKKFVANTGISEKKKFEIKLEAKKRILKIRQSPTALNTNLYNSFVLGIHNYFCKATIDRKIADIMTRME
ncbi:hypothetical protein HQN88_16920 [Paenibacillus qinlingensis]|nr:hypothetical protein [Paenibacillus qinlingensis]